jgi:hypothetical protein
VVFDFVSQLYSLLSDPFLNQLENLVFTPGDPFGKYQSPGGILGEMMSGEWYHNAWEHMTRVTNKTFLIPIILYIDKTVLSQSNKLSVYPVSMSLGIFTEKARRSPWFWRQIGYVPSDDVFMGAAEKSVLGADKKNERFHKILGGILKSYIQAQHPSQLNNITMQLGPYTKMVNLYLPLAYIIGDIEGGNQLCGYKGFTRMECNRVSMTCNCPTSRASDPGFTCERIIQSKVQEKVWLHDTASLDEMCQRPTELVFFNIDCGNDPHGVFSMIMTEPLHSLESGLFPYIMEVLLKSIPSKEHKAELDRLIQDLAHLPRQHGMDGFPRLRWLDGVTSLTHLTGDQKTGKFFAVAVLSDTQAGKEFFSEAFGSETKWQDMNEVFQMLLCYWAWLKRETFWPLHDTEAETAALTAIQVMITRLTRLWPRTDGNCWDLPKIHAQFHVTRNIARFGNQLNVHSGPQEHNHIELSKEPAKHTQRRQNGLEMQLAIRLSERLLIQKAYELMHPDPKRQVISETQSQAKANDDVSAVSHPSTPDRATNQPHAAHFARTEANSTSPGESSCTTSTADESDALKQATKGELILSQNSDFQRINATIHWDNDGSKLMLLPHFDDIVALLIHKYWKEHATTLPSGDKELKFPIYTEYNRNGTVFRTHNNY